LSPTAAYSVPVAWLGGNIVRLWSFPPIQHGRAQKGLWSWAKFRTASWFLRWGRYRGHVSNAGCRMPSAREVGESKVWGPIF